MSYVFPACYHFLLCELVGEAPCSILRRGSCSLAALTSESLLSVRPQPASYVFSHCRALPLGTDHTGLMWLLPWDAQSLCAAQEVFSCLLFAQWYQCSSFSPLVQRAKNEFPSREMQPPVVLPPTSSWVFGIMTERTLATLCASAPAQGGETLVAQGKDCNPERWACCQGSLATSAKVLGCSFIRLKFS